MPSVSASEDIDDVENMILFDPMTHTPERSGSNLQSCTNLYTDESMGSDSGLGDDGVKGLCNFVESHHCNNICTRLDLVSMEILRDTVYALSSRSL